MGKGSESGPLRSLEATIAERGATPAQLEPGARAAANAPIIPAPRRRPLVLRFAGGTDSLALVELGEAASLLDGAPGSS